MPAAEIRFICRTCCSTVCVVLIGKTSECRSASARVRRRRRIITDENLERFLELAPTHTNYELAQIFNLTTVQAGCVRRRYGNTCSPELRARAYAEMGIRMGERRKRRIALGLDPDYFTRDYKKMNTDKLLSKGYIVDEEASVAYWDEKTRRSKIMETRQTYYTFQQWTPEIAKQYEN